MLVMGDFGFPGNSSVLHCPFFSIVLAGLLGHLPDSFGAGFLAFSIRIMIAFLCVVGIDIFQI
jgi:hypothetical protein